MIARLSDFGLMLESACSQLNEALQDLAEKQDQKSLASIEGLDGYILNIKLMVNHNIAMIDTERVSRENIVTYL